MRTNHSDLPSSNLMAPGEYEVVVNNIQEACTQGGTEYVSIDLVVRNDVEQRYQNKHIFESAWLTENAMPYTEQTINKIDCVLDMPEADYADYNAWGDAVQGRALRIKVGHTKATDQYEARERVTSWMATRFPDVKHLFRPQAYGDAAAPAARTENRTVPARPAQTRMDVASAGYMDGENNLPF